MSDSVTFTFEPKIQTLTNKTINGTHDFNYEDDQPLSESEILDKEPELIKEDIDVYDYFSKKPYTDFKLIVDGKVLHIIKGLLMKHSKVFCVALQECEDNQLKLNDVKYQTIVEVLKWMDGICYMAKSSVIDVFKFSHKYDIPLLTKKCIEYIDQNEIYDEQFLNMLDEYKLTNLYEKTIVHCCCDMINDESMLDIKNLNPKNKEILLEKTIETLGIVNDVLFYELEHRKADKIIKSIDNQIKLIFFPKKVLKKTAKKTSVKKVSKTRKSDTATDKFLEKIGIIDS